MATLMFDLRSSRRGSKHGIDRDTWARDASQYVARGQDLPQTKLLDLDVIEIRSAQRQRKSLLDHIRKNLSNEALAKKHGVSVRTVEKVLSRETHSNIP
jgi:transcriptional regulator GlxA family with amidase domain